MSNRTLQVDRSITFGLVLAVLVQTAGALLWAGAAEARLSTLEAQAAHEPSVAERLARLEEQMMGARESLSRIEHRLDGER